ncbi:MAG: long-chain fatty acid--CoA ligase [Candidatus Marinimicrobia bacterium]|nr:long-chain fatty acid--CoA ligase [Candidatus Neomarinimicrobiota bacterium]MCF7921414.1 long-chain fatty acid--CoA ligase [Candidatus Neomarinimicrobiota bacterium]
MEFKTIAEMFLNVTKSHAEAELFTDKVNGEWVGDKGKDIYEMVKNASYGLAALGIKPKDHVAILSTNCRRWAYSDYAIATRGASSVTVYPTLIASQVQYIIAHSDSKLLFAQDAGQMEKVLQIKADCPELISVVYFDESLSFDDEDIISFNELMEKGKAFAATDDAYDFETQARSVSPDDILTLIYTSGTTGSPKGVMLTHNNLVSNIISCNARLGISDKDKFLSFLPLSHSFERLGDYVGTHVGANITYAESMDKVIANLSEVNPTVAMSVPRLYEKMYAGVQAKFAGGSFIKRKIASWAVKTGFEYVDARNAGNISPKLAKKKKRADKLVFSKVQALLGTQFKLFASGGAPLGADIGRFFDAAGITILEGYGLSETSPVITLNPPHDFRFGTVGPTIDGVEVKIADDGEILSRGPHIMKGYYKDEAGTREAINEEGWFHTGDIGIIDDGYLKITDRKKNIIVTAGGKNIAPAPIEGAIIMNKFFEQALVHGDRRKFVSALVVPNYDEVGTWAKEHDIVDMTPESLCENPKVYDMLMGEIEEIMKNFSGYEAVKKIIVLPREFSIEDGTLTPTLKIKKRVVEERYKAKMDALYE